MQNLRGFPSHNPRLEACEKESSIFPRRAPGASVASREIATNWGSDVELEEMESEQTGLAFSLPPSPERVRANSPVEFAHYYLFPSPRACDTVSFGLDNILQTAASDSENFGPALADVLPPSGQEAWPSAAYSELVDVLSRDTEKLALDWPDEPHESRASKLDERFLSSANSKFSVITFFSDLHQEISRSWKQPFSCRLTNAAAADFTKLVGSVEQGYTAMPVVEDTLASHLSPSLAPSWKSCTLLPSKSCRTTSALIGKSYIAAGQAGMALHTMAILQAYQADVLKEMDEGTGLTPEAVKELRRATDLALRATKHTARAVGAFPDDSGHRCVRPSVAECQSVRVSANKADSGSTMQNEGEQCPSPSHSHILALPNLVLGANSPLVSVSLGDSDQAGLTVPASGQDLASSTRALEVVGMAHTGPRAVMNVLPVEVQETIASARAPATRKLYSSKWGVFESWCLARAIGPFNCPVGPVLEFLQERLTAGAAATTLRVYVAAIAARRELDEIPLGRHRMVSAFMRGVRRLRPVRPTAVPSWDLSVVLEGLVMAPFEPLESASERILTLKVTLLLALTSLKRVGDLQAFSVSETCMDFAPGLVKVTLRPRPGYIPKVLSTSFRSQVATLHSFYPPPFASSEDERLHMLCPVRALETIETNERSKHKVS